MKTNELDSLRKTNADLLLALQEVTPLLRHAFDALDGMSDSDVDYFDSEEEEAEAVPAQYAARKVMQAIQTLDGLPRPTAVNAGGQDEAVVRKHPLYWVVRWERSGESLREFPLSDYTFASYFAQGVNFMCGRPTAAAADDLPIFFYTKTVHDAWPEFNKVNEFSDGSTDGEPLVKLSDVRASQHRQPACSADRQREPTIPMAQPERRTTATAAACQVDKFNAYFRSLQPEKQAAMGPAFALWNGWLASSEANRKPASSTDFRIDLTDDEAATLRDYISESERPVTLIEAEGRDGYGLYIFDTEYPDECGEFIAKMNRNHAKGAGDL